MAAKNNMIISIALIAVLLVIAAVLFFMGLSNKGKFESCENNENANCFALTCPSSGGSPNETFTATCREYAYRCVDANHVMCSYASGVVMPINPADNGIIVCSGNNIPCTDPPT